MGNAWSFIYLYLWFGPYQFPHHQSFTESICKTGRCPVVPIFLCPLMHFCLHQQWNKCKCSCSNYFCLNHRSCSSVLCSKYSLFFYLFLGKKTAENITAAVKKTNFELCWAIWLNSCQSYLATIKYQKMTPLLCSCPVLKGILNLMVFKPLQQRYVWSVPKKTRYCSSIRDQMKIK